MKIEGLPEMPAEILKNVYDNFPHYLFFTTEKPGVRKYHCTACNNTYYRGTRVQLREQGHEDVCLETARHGEVATCPLCGEKVKVINTKLQLRLKEPFIKISDQIAFFFNLSENDVWVRCMFVNRTYSYDGTYVQDDQNETNIYHLTPQGAQHWKKDWSPYYGWYDDFESEQFAEPFQWDHGMSHRKYEYGIWTVTERHYADTFLKYSGYNAYLQQRPSAPMLKYFCWYCNHPQIEMLSKLCRTETVDELIFYNKDMRSILDWNAKKPWELYRLSKPEYNIWIERGHSIKTLKLYKRLKSHNPKDFKTAETLLPMCWNRLKDAISTAARISKYGKTPHDAIKYFERIARNSSGCCHCCVGITTKEAADLWIDYVNMADDGKSNFSPFPSDLKTAHDNLLDAFNIKKARISAAEIKKQNQKTVEQIRRKYRNANKNMQSVKKKYDYDNGKLAFVMPVGIADVLYDGKVLNQCTARPDATGTYWRYFDRINRKETFIGFVRKSGSKDIPWFTIEFEPGGTVRQKRTRNDSQPVEETSVVTAFLVEWQREISARLTDSDISDAKNSKIERLQEFEELRRSKKTITYGTLNGTALIEAFEKDLMEIENEIA